MKAELKRIVKYIAPYGIITKYNLNVASASYLNSIENTPEPEIYNKYRERMRVFYLQDTLGRHLNSFCAGRQSRFILWDRSNMKLDFHFYSHEQILKPAGTPRKKYAILVESDQILPQDYLIFDKHPGLNRDFDAIFTFSDRLLDKYENARLYINGGVWYGTPKGGGEIRSNLFEEKTANASMLCSNKEFNELHKLRKEIAFFLRNNHLADTFGDFDGGTKVQVSESLTKYRFSVAVENSLTRNFFTEKIMNCFASMTIPIYIGADNVGSFFNIDGIVQLSHKITMMELEKVIKSCTKEFYDERIDAIKDNFNRVQEYLCPEDNIYSRYSHLFA